MVTLLDVSAVAGHHAMLAALLFSAIFAKGNNFRHFPFVSQDDIDIPQWDLLLI